MAAFELHKQELKQNKKNCPTHLNSSHVRPLRRLKRRKMSCSVADVKKYCWRRRSSCQTKHSQQRGAKQQHCYFARLRVIVGIEHVRDVLAPLALLNLAVVVAAIERLEIKLVRRLGRPEADVQRVVRVVAGNGRVVSNSQDSIERSQIGGPRFGLPRVMRTFPTASMCVPTDRCPPAHWARTIRQTSRCRPRPSAQSPTDCQS